jgi:hypothetical protein
VDDEVKVWLGGEGPSEIGDRDRPDGERVGAIEALLRKVEPDGWRVAGAVRWQHIRKFTVGAARGRHNHGDIHSVAGLVNMAFEAGCPVVAFTRDVDADPDRADAIRRGIEHARAIPHLSATQIIGGPAEPALEGWILALLGVRDTEAMSRQKANRLLDERGLGGKRAEDYVRVIEEADLALASDADLARLPPGCAALRAWLHDARATFVMLIRRA